MLAREGTFLASSALLFVTSAGGTIHWSRVMSGGTPMPGGWTLSMAWMQMPGQTRFEAAAAFVAMWVVMMVAMMLPSLVPVLSSYRRAVREHHAVRLGGPTALAGAAYFVVWGMYGSVVYGLGVGVTAAAMQWPDVARYVPLTTGLVLLLAGWVQLTAWKARQLGRCRETLACGRSEPPDARRFWQHGLQLGVHCVLCCSGFMTLLLVTGMMNLGVIALVAAAITVERLAPRPERVTRAAGFVVLTAGTLLMARALTAM